MVVVSCFSSRSQFMVFMCFTSKGQVTIVLCCFSSRDQLTVIVCKSLLYTSTSVHMTILTDGPVQLVIASDNYLNRSVVIQSCLSMSTRQVSCVILHTVGLSPGPGTWTYIHC